MLQYEFNIHVEHYLVAIEDTNLPKTSIPNQNIS